MRHENESVSRVGILSRAWSADLAGNDSVIESCIAYLRKKGAFLGYTPPDADYLIEDVLCNYLDYEERERILKGLEQKIAYPGPC